MIIFANHSLASTLLFAFSDTACMMLVSRAIQGIGTSFSTVSGLGLLAHRFPDHENRGKYLALSFTGFGLGVLVGPPFGSVVFAFAGKHTPFYILAAIGALDGILQLCTYQSQDREVETMKEGSSLLRLETKHGTYFPWMEFFRDPNSQIPNLGNSGFLSLNNSDSLIPKGP